MRKNSSNISIVFASLLLTSSSWISMANASLDERADDAIQQSAPTHTPIKQHVLEEGTKTGWLGNLFSGWWSTPKATPTVVEAVTEQPKDPSSITPTSSASLKDDEGTPTESAEAKRVRELEAQLQQHAEREAQLKRYAEKKGRTYDDLSMSIMGGALPSVDELAQQMQSMKISAARNDDKITISGLEDQPLDTIKDTSGISIPLYRDLYYYAKHRSSKVDRTEWLTGENIFKQRISAQNKKFKILKIAESPNSESAFWTND